MPFVHAQQRLMLKETESGELFIFTLDGLEVARYFLALDRHQRVVVASHYNGLTTSSNRAHLMPMERQTDIYSSYLYTFGQ